MLKFLFLFLFFFVANIQPVFAQKQNVQISSSIAIFSEKFLGLKNEYRSPARPTTKLSIKYDLNNYSSKLALNYNVNEKYTLDGSYLQHVSGILTYGVGAIDRHWSFSENTSLILSQNARPTKSIYLKLQDNFRYNWLPTNANWSLDIFNGTNEGSLNNTKSMLLGARAILSPVKGLDFELVQTSQWGGQGYNNGVSALGAALLMDTNKGKNSNINKMAGFGISYLIPHDKIPLRIYGQAIGEDEAGSLPSCYSYLAGLEWKNARNEYPTAIGIELVDTRIKTTDHGYCGPNTMYNNSIYKYSNYETVMGASIDTEGKSLELFGQFQVSPKFTIQYSTKLVTINDKNWTNHRLSSNRQSGLINSLDVSWQTKNLNFNVHIFDHGIMLDKASLKDSSGIGFSSSIIF
jgi:hypothetical protein